MGLFGLFGKKHGKDAPTEEEGPFLEDYAGMEAAVTDLEGDLLFTAKLLGVEGSSGRLHQISQTVTAIRETEELLPVQLRGYSGRKSKAAYLSGAIRPSGENRIWTVENLALMKLENDRSFFRMGVEMDAAVTPVERPGASEEPCRLVDLSVGGVRLASRYPHQAGERLLLSLDLGQGKAPSTMLCQVLRVIGQEGDYEYGCRFIDLDEAEQDRITQLLFALQRKQSGRM